MAKVGDTILILVHRFLINLKFGFGALHGKPSLNFNERRTCKKYRKRFGILR